MADKSARYPENVPGKYYVDNTCIACGACAGEAPDNFRMNDDESFAICFKQPSGAKEEAESVSALEICPVNAIGNDG